MSGAVHANVWRSASVGGATLLTLLALADAANDQGDVDAPLGDIATKARTTERHVRRIVEAIDAMEGCSAVHSRGRIIAQLGAFAVVRTPAPMVVEADPAPADILSNSDILSAADEMSGHPVRSGRNVRATATLSPPMAPPFPSPSLPPTPPNQTPSDPPPLSPPTPRAKTEPKGAVSGATAGRDERAIRWRPFYAAVSEGFGGLRVVNAQTGAALAWVGQLAAIAGKATDDDPVAASSLWREFTEDPRFEFAGNGGDTTVAAFGKWVRMRSAAERRAAAKKEPQWLTN